MRVRNARARESARAPAPLFSLARPPAMALAGARPPPKERTRPPAVRPPFLRFCMRRDTRRPHGLDTLLSTRAHPQPVDAPPGYTPQARAPTAAPRPAQTHCGRGASPRPAAPWRPAGRRPAPPEAHARARTRPRRTAPTRASTTLRRRSGSRGCIRHPRTTAPGASARFCLGPMHCAAAAAAPPRRAPEPRRRPAGGGDRHPRNQGARRAPARRRPAAAPRRAARRGGGAAGAPHVCPLDESDRPSHPSIPQALSLSIPQADTAAPPAARRAAGRLP